MIEESQAAKEPSHPILYSCSCNGSIKPSSDVATGPTTALFPLSQLYFCDSCTDIRCPLCTSEEFSGYFCPNCLFDSVTIAVKTEKARCNRQCFDCPVCFSALAVVPVPLADSTGTAVVLSSTATTKTDSEAPMSYILSCPYCRWDSSSLGSDWVFDKPTGLAARSNAVASQHPTNAEFEALRSHFEKVLAANTETGTPYAPSNSLTASLTSAITPDGRQGADPKARPSSSSSLVVMRVSKLLAKASAKKGISTKPKEVGDFQSTVTWPHPWTYETEQDDSVAERERAAALSDFGITSSLATRVLLSEEPLSLNSQLRPQRTQLRTKRIRKCRSCQNILVRPENKSGATKFTIKMIGLKYLPSITVANPAYAYRSASPKLFLRIANPYDDDLCVRLSSSATTGVEFSATDIVLKGLNEFGEYPAPKAGEKFPPGVVDQRENWAVVEIGGRLVESEDSATDIQIRIDFSPYSPDRTTVAVSPVGSKKGRAEGTFWIVARKSPVVLENDAPDP
ncbi:hypothetical protein M427DRAFT_137287 [Gonapodya prolifera JEL478]|uniref:Dynactin subunit 4 n=1 Tax=Gonapodya prolifera (strain JEL478) TaxID=1344416 RepID=A0A139A6G4_GONPJ|nr:hypothetical protein M427DRAFT_137287 [Gonapodya prolifera JEL478]|eukprot:KXS12396.1 hypothetical protein M427DRAFT_137287 [Gonapodya prolifera JEL478]